MSRRSPPVSTALLGPNIPAGCRVISICYMPKRLLILWRENEMDMYDYGQDLRSMHTKEDLTILYPHVQYATRLILSSNGACRRSGLSASVMYLEAMHRNYYFLRTEAHGTVAMRILRNPFPARFVDDEDVINSYVLVTREIGKSQNRSWRRGNEAACGAIASCVNERRLPPFALD